MYMVEIETDRFGVLRSGFEGSTTRGVKSLAYAKRKAKHLELMFKDEPGLQVRVMMIENHGREYR